MKVLVRGLSAALLSVAVLAPAAPAAPVTVDLRIEGPTRTVFEGSVTTDVRPWKFTDESTEHECNGTSSTGGPSSVAVPTRNAAVMAAVYGASPFSVTGTWYSFGPAIDEIGGEDVSYDFATGKYLAEFHNWQADSVGGCSRQVANGDDALMAYSTGSEPLLKLTAPQTARPGEAVTVKVVDGRDGSPVTGATVEGRLTGADGQAQLGPYTERGVHTFKADKPDTVRSNRGTVCVTDGQDGFCGTRTPEGQTIEPAPAQHTPAPDRTDPMSAITNIREGKVFRRGKAPRVLRGEVSDDSGLRMVKLRITRRARDRCSTYSRTRERFMRRRCGARHGWWFRIGDSADWEYQLATRLPRGRYVLDVKAWDNAWNVDAERKRGLNRVVFHVR